MPLPPSGTISMSQVNVELLKPDTTLIALNDPAVRELAKKPSGQISMSDLYGKSSTFTFRYGGGANFNLATLANGRGWDGESKLVAIIEGNVLSSTTASAAIVVDGPYPNGVEIQILAGVYVLGKGGDGGKGGWGGGQTYQADGGGGGVGGVGILASSTVSIDNKGYIGGGGGGGAGGGAGGNGSANGGGGGGGANYGGGGGAQGGGSGTAGGLTTGGGGGGKAGGSGSCAEDGYSGGGLGAAGGGYNHRICGGGWTPAAAAGGAAVAGNSNVNWIDKGTIYGALN